MGSTSTVSFIPEENLYFGINSLKESCNFNDLDPLINNLTLNFLFSLNIGAFTGPRTFALILSSKKVLK